MLRRASIGPLLLLLAFPVPAGAAEGPVQDRPLLFLGNDRIPPFIWVENQRPVGLVIDLARALVDNASLHARIEAMAWPRAQAMVEAGEADALLQINPSPGREQAYDFSGPLLESHFHLFRRTNRPEIQGLDALAGKRVGVEAGGLPMEYLTGHGQARPVAIPNWQRGFEMLLAGQLDAVFVDRWVGEYELQLNRIEGIAVVDPPVVTSSSRIAVKKGNRALLERIDAGLASIQADGTRERILRQWRGKEVVYVSRESVGRLTLLAAGAFILLLTLITLMALAYARKVRKTNRLLAQRERALIQESQGRGEAVAALEDLHSQLEQRVAERTAELQLRELQYRTLVDATSAITWSCPPSGLHVAPQPAWMAFTGQTAEEMLGAGWTKAVHPDDVADAARRWTEAAARNVPFVSDHRIRRHDGAWRWMRVQAVPIRDADGQARGWFGMNLDITDVKRAEQALQRSREGLSRLAEASLSVMAKTDLGDMLHAIAEAALALTGARLATCGHGLADGQSVLRRHGARAGRGGLPARGDVPPRPGRRPPGPGRGRRVAPADGCGATRTPPLVGFAGRARPAARAARRAHARRATARRTG